MLGIPNIPPPPPSTNQKPGLSFFESLKKYAAAQQQLKSLPPTTEQSLSPPEQSSSPLPADETSKPVNRKLRSTPSSALSRRIKNLEREVKGRKKGNKRSSGWWKLVDFKWPNKYSYFEECRFHLILSYHVLNCRERKFGTVFFTDRHH